MYISWMLISFSDINCLKGRPSEDTEKTLSFLSKHPKASILSRTRLQLLKLRSQKKKLEIILWNWQILCETCSSEFFFFNYSLVYSMKVIQKIKNKNIIIIMTMANLELKQWSLCKRNHNLFSRGSKYELSSKIKCSAFLNLGNLVYKSTFSRNSQVKSQRYEQKTSLQKKFKIYVILFMNKKDQ